MSSISDWINRIYRHWRTSI